MYYLYQHIRNDNGDVFYVGIGDKYRPNEKSSRNKFWNNIVSKTEYTVEIVRSFDSWNDACDWERFFIGIYGRRIDNTGTLVNLTYGGDGTSGFKHKASSIEKRREIYILNNSVAIDAYSISTKQLVGSYINMTEASYYLGVNRGAIYACINSMQYRSGDYTFCYFGELPKWEEIDSSLMTGKSISGRARFLQKFSKPVIQYSLSDVFISEYPSATEAGRSIGKSHSSIVNCANQKPGHLTAYGYKWKWKQ